MEKFDNNEIIYNRVKAFPNWNISIYDGRVYYNSEDLENGQLASPIKHAGHSKTSLYELNIDRASNNLIYPFIVKGSDFNGFASVENADFHSSFNYGDVISGSYPLSGSVTRRHFITSASGTRSEINSLQSSLDFYATHSPHFYVSSSLGDKNLQAMSMISIPAHFYGSKIRKGSVSLKWYLSGSILAEARDLYQNGNLIEVTGSNVGAVAGQCLYSEGFLLLTGSWAHEVTTRDYLGTGAGQTSAWNFFGVGMNDNIGSGKIPYVSYEMDFQGEQYINTISMFCKAPEGEYNNSPNPTWISYGQNISPITSSIQFAEPNIEIKNIVKTPWPDPTGSFEKICYVQHVNIFDENKKLLAKAKMARPIRKREQDGFTFKLKLDI